MAIHSKRLRLAALLVPLGSLFLLAGCSGVLESGKPARHVYLLQPPASPAATPTAAGATLVLSVTAVPGLDTDRILVLGRDARLNPVANAHWADHLPEIFTSVTRRALADSGRFGRVTVGSIARPEEWLIEVELQAFYGLTGASGDTERVTLRLEAGLRCGDTHERFAVEETTSATAASISSLVAAHQRVLDEALRALPGRIAAHCAD